MNYAYLFEEHIKIQQKAIRSSGIWAVLFFALGASLAISPLVGYLDRSLIPEVVKLGGGFFMSGVSFYQIKDVIQRRERIASYTYLKTTFEGIDELPQDQQQQLVQLAVDMIKETMKR